VSETRGTDGILLDVGCGIGALTFELLERGMNQAVAVNASAAYLAAASEEAARRGASAAIQDAGFELAARRRTWQWSVDVYIHVNR
jgi:cyclopropane fatty-acyl-phospholipid synthase-like methyltransferase